MSRHPPSRRPFQVQGPLFQALLFLFFLFVVAEVESSDLSRDELERIFGDLEKVPKYSLFEPVVRHSTESSRWERSVSEDQSTHLTFNALGRAFSFKLQLVEDLWSPHFVILRRNRDSSDVLDWESSNYKCFFRGTEEGPRAEGKMTLALEMCGEMRGVITGKEEDFVIEPLPLDIKERRRKRSTAGTLLSSHLIYRRQNKDGCSLHADPLGTSDKGYLFSRKSLLNPRYFDSYEIVLDGKMRSAPYKDWEIDDFSSKPAGDKSAKYIELAAFVDEDLLRHMQSNFPGETNEQTIKFVLAMVNAIQILYKDESLGHDIKFVLKRLELLYEQPVGLETSHNIDKFLTNFCVWQRKQNPLSDSDPLHWDHSLILTGLDLYTIVNAGEVNSQVVGLAPVSGMCTKSSSCTVNEGRHFESVYVVAHEIGHNLGMRHDGLQAGNNCDPGKYLMSPTLGSGKVTWSSCSRKYLNKFLRTRQAECLRDVSEASNKDLDHETAALPGQRFDADQQCMLKHGSGSRHDRNQRPEEICQDLYCRRDHYTWTSHPALEGTSCGPRKRCHRGDCALIPGENPLATPPVISEAVFQSIHSSVRGEWGPWSDCRSSCLYGQDGILSSGSTGLSLSKRQCQSCRDEYRYSVCSAVHQCSFVARRTIQDFAHEICHSVMHESKDLTGLASKIPASGLSQCTIQCQMRGSKAPYDSKRSYPDGTACTSSSRYSAYCVAGVCTEFRCQPETLYGADPITCRPDISVRDPYRPLGHSSKPSLVPLPAESQVSSTFRPSDAPSSSPLPKWGPWASASTCRFSCMTTAKGIQLVTRACLGSNCLGIDRNIQLCSPHGIAQCHGGHLKTPFEFSTEVCTRYRAKVEQLSGLGMQLENSPEDPDRACSVACQDVELEYRFYRVNGRDGWFPFGTSCSRSPPGAGDSFCLNGKCLDFAEDGTPLRNASFESLRSARLNSMFQEVPWMAFQELFQPLVRTAFAGRSGIRTRRDVIATSHRLPGSIDEDLILSLVDSLNRTLMLNESSVESSSVDLENPFFVSGLLVNLTSGQTPLKNTASLHQDDDVIVTPDGGSSSSSLRGKFSWKVMTSQCSVTCGAGMEEVVVLCAREQPELAVVEPRNCPGESPATPGYRACHAGVTCPGHTLGSISFSDFPEGFPKSAFSRWIIGILQDVKIE